MIEPLDSTRGDYHPTRLGDKLNEVIEWIDAHEKPEKIQVRLLEELIAILLIAKKNIGGERGD